MRITKDILTNSTMTCTRYKNKDERHALKLVRVGGGTCHGDVDCGEGHCSFHRCVCDSGWQGPKCLVCLFRDDFVKITHFAIMYSIYETI
jgi:hypothetical protein